MKLPFQKHDEGAIDYKRTLRTIAVQDEAQNGGGAQEYAELTARAGFLITDQIAIQMLLENHALESFIFSLSPTNSVIYLSKRQADLKRLRWENLVNMVKACMQPYTFEHGGLEALENIRMYGHDRISGAEEGFVGKMATQTTKVHRFEEGKGDKR